MKTPETVPPWEEAGAIAAPAPVRATPVPLTVRRHTEQSKQIWFDNLYAALPADMLPEDKERITDALLEVAITHGDTLRRKRIVDKLMNAAEQMDDRGAFFTPTNLDAWRERLREWSELLMDAAEEIRSVM